MQKLSLLYTSTNIKSNRTDKKTQSPPNTSGLFGFQVVGSVSPYQSTRQPISAVFMKGSIVTMPLVQVSEIYKRERYIIDSVPHVVFYLFGLLFDFWIRPCHSLLTKLPVSINVPNQQSYRALSFLRLREQQSLHNLLLTHLQTEPCPVTRVRTR